MDPYYPPTSFYFSVRFEQIKTVAQDFRFQSVSGLTAEVITETYREGGQNIKDHVLPVKTQYPDLVLKRGLLAPQTNGLSLETNDLQQWCLKTMETLLIKPTDITISLLNGKGLPLMTWSVKRAWPKKWSISEFNAEENQLAIESMEFNYYYFSII